MRWIFVFLVFLNIFFYIWQRQQTPITYSTNQITQNNTPTIKLLSEQPNTPLLKQKQQAPITTPIADTATDNELPTTQLAYRTCLYLGGFANQQQLTTITPYLTELDSKLQPTIVEQLAQTPKLHLYIMVDSLDQLLAVLIRLDKAHIYSLIIPNGPLKNNISLGIFTSQEAYEPLQKRLQSLNLPPQVETLTESATRYWLKIPMDKQQLFTLKALTKLKQQLPTMQQALMPCNLPEKD